MRAAKGVPAQTQTSNQDKTTAKWHTHLHTGSILIQMLRLARVMPGLPSPGPRKRDNKKGVSANDKTCALEITPKVHRRVKSSQLPPLSFYPHIFPHICFRVCRPLLGGGVPSPNLGQPPPKPQPADTKKHKQTKHT